MNVHLYLKTDVTTVNRCTCKFVCEPVLQDGGPGADNGWMDCSTHVISNVVGL